MIQTWAIIVDAYRELNSRKLFWISMGLSLLVVAVFGCIGLTPRGLQILWIDVPFYLNSTLVSPADFYKLMFAQLGVGFWLGWVCTILALVSTAGMIPDLITNGSIELMLSKPIGRLRLFITKYITGLMFAGLQVLVFTGACFLVIGLRGGDWLPSLFLAVPIVVAFFSYLFCICVLLGMVTRSTVASLLITLLVWFGLFALSATERAFLSGTVMAQQRVAFFEKDVEAQKLAIQRIKDEAAKRKDVAPATTKREARPKVQEDATNSRDGADAPDSGTPTETAGDAPPSKPRKSFWEAVTSAFKPVNAENPLEAAEAVLVEKERQVALKRLDAEWWERWHTPFYNVRTFLPKTDETKELLTRTIASEAGMQKFMNDGGGGGRPPPGMEGVNMRKAARMVEERLRERTTAWVIGTSLGFEFVVLCLAGWMFCRRDF